MTSRDIIRVCGLSMALVGAWCLLVTRTQADSRGAPEHGSADDRPAPVGCPTSSDIAQRIDALLGRSLREAAPSLRVETWLQQTATGYLLTLRTGNAEPGASFEATGTRTFEGAQCAALAEAAALLVALSVDPLAAPAGPRAAPAGPVYAPAEPAVVGAEAARRAPREDWPRSATRSLRAGLRAGVLLDVGYLPRVGAGAELGASLAFVRSRFELSALWLPGVRSDRAEDGARVEVALWAARASYCHWLLGQAGGLLAVGSCLGLELGRASGTGLDVIGPQERHFGWTAGWLALRLSTELTHWLGVALEPAVVVPFARSRFVSSAADGSQRAEVHTPAPVAARVALSIEALF